MGATSTKHVQPLYLHDDILVQVARFMDSKSLLAASLTCRHFRSLFRASLGRPDSVFAVSLCGKPHQERSVQLRHGRAAARFAREVCATALRIPALHIWLLSSGLRFPAVTDLTLVQYECADTCIDSEVLSVFPCATRVKTVSAPNNRGTTIGLSDDMMCLFPKALTHFEGELSTFKYCPTFDFSVFTHLRELRVKLTRRRPFSPNDLHCVTLKVPSNIEVLHVTFAGICAASWLPGPFVPARDLVQVGFGEDSVAVHKIVGLATCANLRDVRVVGYGHLEFDVLRGVRRVAFGCRQCRGRAEQCDTVTIEHYMDTMEAPERTFRYENEGELVLVGVREFSCALERFNWTMEKSGPTSLQTVVVPFTENNIAEVLKLKKSIRRLTFINKEDPDDSPGLGLPLLPQLEFVKLVNIPIVNFRAFGRDYRETEIWCKNVGTVLVDGKPVDCRRFILPLP